MALEDHNKGPAFLAVFGTGTTVAAICVFLRLWVRGRIIRKLGLDDWIVALSLVLVFGSLGCFITSVHYGLGRHKAFLTSKQSENAVKMVWIGFCITPSAEATAKISVSLMLIRITTSARWRWFFRFLIISFIMVTIAILFAVLFSCRPLQFLWEASSKNHCDTKERTILIYIQGVTAALYDTLLAVSPIFLLWNVQMDVYKKIMLCGLLALGFFTTIAGIIRITYTPQSKKTEDPTWGIINFVIWKTVELPLSIIVGCLPTLRPLFGQKSRQSAPELHEDKFVLRDGQQRGRIKQTTFITVDTITVDTSVVSSGDVSLKQNAWDVEERV